MFCEGASWVYAPNCAALYVDQQHSQHSHDGEDHKKLIDYPHNKIHKDDKTIPITRFPFWRRFLLSWDQNTGLENFLLLSILEAILKLHLICQPTGKCCCLESLMLQTLEEQEPSLGHLQIWSALVHSSHWFDLIFELILKDCQTYISISCNPIRLRGV